MLFPERDAIDLAGAEARQWRVGENHPRRDLEGGDTPLEEGAQAFLVEAAAHAGMDDRDRDFAKPIVGRAEHGRFGNVMAAVKRGFDLGRANFSRRG